MCQLSDKGMQEHLFVLAPLITGTGRRDLEQNVDTNTVIWVYANTAQRLDLLVSSWQLSTAGCTVH